MRRVLLAVAAGVAVIFSLGFVMAPAANALPCGDAHDATDTDATLNIDGSMDVVETLTFDFDSGCHGGIREINTSGADIPDSLGVSDYSLGPISVTENGESVPIADESTGYVKWGRADKTISGRHVYELRYHVDNAVHVAPDVAVLYWQFLGNGSPDQKHVNVTIHTPGNGQDLKVFAHGVLEGVSSLDGRDVHVNVGHNPEHTAVEVRLLEPATDYFVTPTDPPLKDAILAKEAHYADQANARRRELKDQADRDRMFKNIGTLGSPIVALLGIVAFTGVFLKWGKEPEKPADIGEYWREIPDDPPAVCQTLLQFGAVSTDAFSATLVDLAQRGWLTITEEHSETGILHRDKTDYRFTRTAKADGTLTDYESKLLWRLFPNGGSILQSELVKDAKSTPSSSAAWLDGFKESVQRDFESRGYVDKSHAGKWALHLLTIVVLGGLGALALWKHAWLGLIPIGVAVVLLVLSPLLRKRTEAGARKVAEVEGLRNFLKDFSRLPDEAHAGDLILYERYLVYAVALHVAHELVEGLRVKMPELSEPTSGFATWYLVGNAAGGFANVGRLDSISTIGSFASEFSSATSAAFSPPSSSSGGGGGFSGGGGGGGGGGGSGGW